MKKVFDRSKVMVFLGSGGVGKTTLAAAMGFAAATMGKKVLVLTIDPSQRLKTTLGINDNEQTTHLKINDLKGSLSAAVINPKQTFDLFVKKVSLNEDLGQKILKNKLYIQLSTTLNGSQEFTALERLYTEYESNKYDLIILDTPPSKHVIDFLEAPQKLSSVFNEGIAKWFRQPNQAINIFQFGTKKVLKALEVLTGSEFIHELSDFFSNIHTWQNKLEERIANVHDLLVKQETQFCLVTGFDHAKLIEAEYLFKELTKGGYCLNTVIINRAYPGWFNHQPKALSGLESKVGSYYLLMKSYFEERQLEYLKFSDKLDPHIYLKSFPELDHAVSDLDGIKKLSEYILKP